MMMRRRRPLLRGAMVGGAGYMAGKSVANKQQGESEQEQRIAELERQQAAAAPPPPPPPPSPPQAGAPAGESTIEQLTKLGQLRDSGVLNDAEFEAQKQKILAS